MPKGPFGRSRPFGLGPFVKSDKEGEEKEKLDDNDNDDINLDNIEDKTARAALDMANKWYKSITKDQSKHKMMKNYLREVTELSDEEIENILNKAGI